MCIRDRLGLVQRHARGADLGDAPAELIVRHGLESGGVGVGKVGAPAAVEVEVGKTGNDPAAGQVHPFPVAAGNDLPLPNGQLTVVKTFQRVKDPGTGQPHTSTPAAITLPRAARSATRVTLR